MKCYWILFFQNQPIRNTIWTQSERNEAWVPSTPMKSAPDIPHSISHLDKVTISKNRVLASSQKKRNDTFNVWRIIPWNPRAWIITLSPFSGQFSSWMHPSSSTSQPWSLRNSLKALFLMPSYFEPLQVFGRMRL